MKIQLQLSVFILVPILFTWVACASVPPCASMRSWFPGTNPLPFADNLPYQLSVSGNSYTPTSSHIVYLNGSMTNEMKMRSFVAFIIYAENSVTKYPNGRFVAEDLPPGVEEVNCSTLYIVQNSTSAGNWTSVKLLWKGPKDGHLAGNITFRASVVQQTSPQLWYFEGFTAHLTYECPKIKCVPCPSGSYYLRDNYGCQTCQCGEQIVGGAASRCPGSMCLDSRPDQGICANTTCPFYGNCHPSVDQKTAECKCDIVCAAVYTPVCGTDGKTHGNECGMQSKACVDKKNIQVAYKGECRKLSTVPTNTGAADSFQCRFAGLSLLMASLVFLWFLA